MFYRKTRLLKTLLLIFGLGLVAEVAIPEDALARAGSRRSFGQRSAPPPAQQRYPAAQPMQQNPGSQSLPPNSMPQSGRGSFMKGMAGGLAGGLLGSMLFSSLGHSSGLGGMGGGSGGMGLLDIVLIGGVLFLVYRLWKSRQTRPAMAVAGLPLDSYRDSNYAPGPQSPGYFSQPSGQAQHVVASIDSETAEDIFFKVQGAWTRRDINLLKELAEPEVLRVFEEDMQALKQTKRIKRLENISVRRVDVGESWLDAGRDLVRVRFTASLLDYTVDETSGEVKDGSNSVPVKFDEQWIFAKAPGRSQWLLAGIEQV